MRLDEDNGTLLILPPRMHRGLESEIGVPSPNPTSNRVTCPVSSFVPRLRFLQLRRAFLSAEVSAITPGRVSYCKKHYSLARLPLPQMVPEQDPMRSAAKRKEHPLSMRLPDADIAIIDRAA